MLSVSMGAILAEFLSILLTGLVRIGVQTRAGHWVGLRWTTGKHLESRLRLEISQCFCATVCKQWALLLQPVLSS